MSILEKYYKKYRGITLFLGRCPECGAMMKHIAGYVVFSVDRAEESGYKKISLLCIKCFDTINYRISNLDKILEESLKEYNRKGVINEEKYKIEY